MINNNNNTNTNNTNTNNTLGRNVATVAQDVRRIVELGSKMGLILNACELVAHSGLVVNDPIPRSFSRVEPGDATLLGAPLFPGRVLNDFWSDRCRDLSRAVDRLCLVGRQDALILLRASFSAPRIEYLLRCSPSVDAPGPPEFDNLLRTALSRISTIRVAVARQVFPSIDLSLASLPGANNNADNNNMHFCPVIRLFHRRWQHSEA